MVKEFRSEYAPPDTEILFFRDVSLCEIVAGKSDYLPLTRRIERGRLMLDVMGQDVHQTLRNIQAELSTNRGQLHSLCADTKNDIDGFWGKLTQDVEGFLDNPNWDAPPAFSTLSGEISLSNHDQLRETCWRSFYLFALLPAEARQNYSVWIVTEEVEAHFQMVLKEYEHGKHALIKGTLRYSLRLARYYLDSGIPYLDLVQEGILGVFHAIDNFRESAGAHFQSYAANWIQQRIRRYIADYSRLIRIPVHRHDTAAIIERNQQALTDVLGFEPSDDQLFVAMEWLTEDDLVVLEQHKDEIRRKVILKRVDTYRQLLAYRDHALSEVPEQLRARVIALDMARSLLEELGEEPDDLVLFRELGWLSQEDLQCIQNHEKPKPAKLTQALSKLRKAQVEMRHFRMVNARHYSFDMPIEMRDLLPRTSIQTFLVAESSLENEVDDLVLKDVVQHLIAELGEREREVITLRFGLSDGEERTLEQVGQVFGFTRERARQIEAKAIRQLKSIGKKYQAGDLMDETVFAYALVGVSLRRKLVGALSHQEPLDDVDRSQRVLDERARIEMLIDKYVMQGKKRTSTRSPYGSRAQMFKQILEAAGKPLHYTAIHERALQNLPSEHHFPKDRAYATLFYGDIFQLLGSGMFGLAIWDTVTTGLTGEIVLHHCPQPLLPVDADRRAFFESVMVGRELLKQHPSLTPAQFYAEMLAWAGQSGTNDQAMQSAFDAWYAAGLLERFDVSANSKLTLQLTLDPNSRLNDVRLHCLDALCHRILKMPELLLTLTRIARPVVPDIQKVLFGNERAGFDVPLRLNMLLAFEAVQHSHGEWQLTPVGETILAANPPQELPDFSVIEDALADEDEINGDADDFAWEDELGLLEL